MFLLELRLRANLPRTIGLAGSCRYRVETVYSYSMNASVSPAVLKNPDDLAYAELQALSSFSFQRGASQPGELVQRAADLGYAALALTDECSVAGVVRCGWGT